MREVRRLLDDSPTEFERTVLASSADDAPVVGARDRALAGLGLGVAGVTAAVAAQGVATKAVGAGVSSLAGAAAKGGGMVVAKWAGVAALGVALAVGSVQVARNASTSHDAAFPAITAPLPSPVSAARQAPVAVAAPSAQLAPVPSSAPAPFAPAVRTASGSASPPVVLSPAPQPLAAMTEQLAELKAIRATLASGDAEGAIRQIDAFEASHPVSPLLEEATVLLIDALVAAGRRPEASAMAGSFLRGFPNSAYAEHVQTKVQGP